MPLLVNEYRDAIRKSGAKIIKELKFFDSAINYFPLTKKEIQELKKINNSNQKRKLRKKLGLIGNNCLAWIIYRLLSNYKSLNEAIIPGRMYSYIAIKK